MDSLDRSPMTRATIEAALADVPHSHTEWLDTGGGVHNLLVHATRDDDVDHGPVVGIGPFTPSGAPEFADVLVVWDESIRGEYDDDVDSAPDIATVDGVIAAVRAILAA